MPQKNYCHTFNAFMPGNVLSLFITEIDMKKLFISLALALSTSFMGVAAHAQSGLENTTAAWDKLLKKHVAWNSAGVASSVAYKGFQADRAELKKVLDGFSALTKAEYDKLKKDDKLAFLINAYNAYTVEIILTKYPDLKSIRDIGNFAKKTWSIKFFNLLGEERNLDNVEHDMIRAPGAFDDPRIHMAVVCASIGCPALRPEAFVGATLDVTLEDSVKRFLKDKSRNRFNSSSGKLEVSKIFDWYKGDFDKGLKGITSREQFFGKYAELLATDAAGQQTVKDAKASISFLDYDWSLNDKK
jgi:Protein of unknown function, DUF547